MGQTELTRSGIPLFWDHDRMTVRLGEGLSAEKGGHKTAEHMLGLLANEGELDLKERAYDTVGRLCREADRELFERHLLQYDLTVVMPGDFNGEFKKTSGHYHGWNDTHSHTYGEVYEVLVGSALFVLQRSSDFEELPSENHVEDVILVRVDEGQTLLVPPDYGHASINVGAGPLVFSDLAYVRCPVWYESVRAHHGMAYYALVGKNGLRAVRNRRYGEGCPAARFATVHEDPSLGIDFSTPLYQGFIEHPAAYEYLARPDAYIERIMALLDFGQAPFDIEP